MRIYHRDHAGRPIRAAWVLEEVGQPYELVKMSVEESRGEEHLARHPLGKVPVLGDEDGYVFESAAICMHIADLHPQAGLIPPVGTHERALVYQWASFAPAELEPPLIEGAMWAERDPERSAKARRRFDERAAAVSRALGEEEFLVGDSLTVADVMAGTALAFTQRTGTAAGLPANITAYLARLQSRPAFERALERTSD
jgi:glutathione S-transferase